jgi:Spy/CpxP family protein refolding chaperone
MRIVKASALALAISVSFGVGAAMAADAPAKSHGWFHHGYQHTAHHHVKATTHHICDVLKALFTHKHYGHGHKQVAVQVAY